MKKKLRRQLGGEQMYIKEMYDKWQRVTQRTNQTGKKFGSYLQSIRSNLLDLDAAGAPNETQLIHRIGQGLRSKICAVLSQNPTVTKDWPIFLEDVAQTESSIHLEHKSFPQPTQTPAPAKKKSAESTTNQNHTGQTSRGNHTCGNFRGKSKGV